MIVGVGADLTSLLRIHGILTRVAPLRLAAKILSEEERIALCKTFTYSELGAPIVSYKLPTDWSGITHDQKRLATYFGVRFAIKEAVYKGMYPTRVKWTEVTINKTNGLTSLTSGKPYVNIVGHDDVTCHCSVSHDAGLVFAYCLITKS